MKKKKKQVISLVLGAALAMTSVPQSAMAFQRVQRLSAESDSQMSSEPERVYLNSYGGSARSQDFNDNWKFYLGDPGNAEDPSFNDSAWRTLNLPHDYSIEQEYSRSLEAESGYLPGGTGWYRKNFTIPEANKGQRIRIDFDGIYMNAEIWVNGHKAGSHPYGYTPFSMDITDYISFGKENVISVKVNHKTPSSRWYSGSGIYRSVKLTITSPIHVDLHGTKVTTPTLKSNTSSTTANIETTIANESAEAAEISLVHSFYEKGDETKTTVGTITTDPVQTETGKTTVITSEVPVEGITLWDIEDPQLYTLETKVMKDGAVVDTYETEYGFRYFDWDTEKGFSLNGRPVKLKGVCMHHDQGALGSAAYYAAIERQIEILQEMGCNSIRITHNPGAEDFIKICNEKGMLVIEEFFDGWHMPKNGNRNDYSVWFQQKIGADNGLFGAEADMTWAEYDLKSLVKRDLNAPSIIMWSLGNEVQEGAGGGGYDTIARSLIQWTKEVDDTRIITTGDNTIKNGSVSGEHNNIANSLTEADGAVGVNYVGAGGYDSIHQGRPEWKLYGSETASSINSRGIYKRDGYQGIQNIAKQLTSYDESRVGWGAFASNAWYDVITRDFVAGEYVWTGFDYIGEPTPYNGTSGGAQGIWPSPKNSYFGIIDTAGFPKDSYYLYQSQWNDDVNTLHILPAWNENVVEKELISKNVKVVVYSDAASVELFFTPAGSEETSLGKKTFTQKKSDGGLYTYQIYEGEGKSGTAHENLYLTWNVPYQDGTLRAVAYDAAGNVISDTVGSNTVSTTGAPAKLQASVYGEKDSITADGKDLAYVEVDVLDANGNVVPDAANRVTFKVEGEGELVGVDNGNSPDHDPYQADNRSAFGGKVLAIVRSTKTAGEFTVTAAADGLESSSVTVTTVAAEHGGSETSSLESYLISKNYYVRTGYKPELPEQVQVRYTDGTEETVSVSWEEIPEDLYGKTGVFQLKGTLEGSNASVVVNINMIDSVGALLNYSTYTQKGVAPKIPEARPAVLANGEILNATFPVTWAMPDESVYNEVGIVTIPGTAEVFGTEIQVTASVRVQEETIAIGESVSGQAEELTQNIPLDLQSDTLEAIKDGNTTISDNIWGGPNKTAWSNWDYSQKGNTTAELTFRYATQQRLGQAVIYFARDNNSMRYPDAGTTEIYVSESGEDESWTKIEAKEIIGVEDGRVKPYTYDFAPVLFTFLKVCITNTAQPTGTDQKACTAITEVELRKAIGNFETYSTAALSKLVVNGVEVSSSDLEKGTYSTQAIVVADLEAEGKDNTAVTVLPAFEDKVVILLESEDHMKRDEFVIQLNGDAPTGDASDDSRDYPREKTTATAGAEQPDDPAEQAVDGDTSTLWHSPWHQTTPEKDRWIQLELAEETKLDALRYYGRDDGSVNGRVTKYAVDVSLDGENWTEVSSGTWPNEGGWKIAVFGEPTVAKYVRLRGIETRSDQSLVFMSAGEIRVRKALETIDLSDPNNNVTAELSQDTFRVDEIKEPIKPDMTVTVNGKKLKYGIDYKVTYQGNDKFGTATATATGIIKYSGSISKDFRITDETFQRLTVTGGTIVEIDGKEYTEGSEAEVLVGQKVTIKVSEEMIPDGKIFDHWRMTPASVEISKEEPYTFTMPKSSVTAEAVYADESTGAVDLDVYTTAVPENWMVYGDTAELLALLEGMLNEDDLDFMGSPTDPGTVRLHMTITRSETAPSKKVVLSDEAQMEETKPAETKPEVTLPEETQPKETQPEVMKPEVTEPAETPALLTLEETLPDETADETLEEMPEETPAETPVETPDKAPAATLKKPSATVKESKEKTFLREGSEIRKLMREEAAASASEEIPQKEAFYVTASMEKEHFRNGKIEERFPVATASNASITMELPEEDRDMTDYQVIAYQYEDGEDIVGTVDAILSEDGRFLTFRADMDSIYGVYYTECFDVTFVDYDGRILDVQRVPYGAAAEAPEEPAREGYLFKEWSREFDFITKDITVKAVYEKDTTSENRASLKQTIETIEKQMAGLRESDYTSDTWSDLETALEEAKAAFENPDAGAEELKDAQAALKAAFKALKKRPTSSSSDDDDDDDYRPVININDTQVPLASSYATFGTWGQDEKGWRFRANGSGQPAVGWIYTQWGGNYNWYYFDAEGYMKNGWLNVDGSYYYLSTAQDGTQGVMAAGWQWIKGLDGKERCYYFNEVSDGTRGVLKTNTVINGYAVNADGQWTVNGVIQTR